MNPFAIHINPLCTLIPTLSMPSLMASFAFESAFTAPFAFDAKLFNQAGGGGTPNAFVNASQNVLQFFENNSYSLPGQLAFITATIAIVPG